MMIDRRLLQEIDWVLIGLVLLQALIGVFFIYSSSHFLAGQYHVRQLVWIAVSLAALVFVLIVDYKFFVSLSVYFYGLIVAVLAATLVLAQRDERDRGGETGEPRGRRRFLSAHSLRSSGPRRSGWSSFPRGIRSGRWRRPG